MSRSEKGAVAITVGENVKTPATKVSQVLDTTGAGDAFAGGFLSAWLSGADLKTACERGHQFAGLVVERIGGR